MAARSILFPVLVKCSCAVVCCLAFIACIVLVLAKVGKERPEMCRPPALFPFSTSCGWSIKGCSWFCVPSCDLQALQGLSSADGEGMREEDGAEEELEMEDGGVERQERAGFGHRGPFSR